MVQCQASILARGLTQMGVNYYNLATQDWTGPNLASQKLVESKPVQWQTGSFCAPDSCIYYTDLGFSMSRGHIYKNIDEVLFSDIPKKKESCPGLTSTSKIHTIFSNLHTIDLFNEFHKILFSFKDP